MKSRHLTFKVFLLIIIDSICNIFAQVLLKKGLIATSISPVTLSNLADFVTKNLASPLVWLGIIIYALNFFIWIIILYRVDLSIAIPVGSVSYIFIPIIAIFFLHEHVGLTRWIGIMLIVSGIHFVSRSGRPAEGRSGAHD